MISRVPRRGARENEVESTHKRENEVESTHKEAESELNGEEGPRSTRLNSASGNLALRNRIKELEDKVGQLTVDAEEKGGMYIKKGGVITMECREALSRLVATHGTSFASAYKILVTSWNCAAGLTGMQVRGALTSEEAGVETAVSSVAMSGRQTQFVRAWEMAAVVSGDAREMSGSGLTWCEGERQHDAETNG